MTIRTWGAIALGFAVASGTARAQTTGVPGIGGSGATVGNGTQSQRGAAPVVSGAIPPGAGDGDHAVRPLPTPAATLRAERAAVTVGGSLDSLFVAFAAESSLAEVATARLAAARSSSIEVRRMAQRMLDDHTRIGRELADLAAHRSMAAPAALSATAQAELSALASAPAGEFDRCYAAQQLAAHLRAVGLFEAEAEQGRDGDVKAWAARTLETLRQHADQVKALHESLSADRRPAR